jgi:3-oxoacyl-[acyl-carrier protein] reductase
MKDRKRLVVVTGTSGGLGSAIAKKLCHEGFDVVGIARREVDPEAISTQNGTYSHISWDLGEIAKLKSLSDQIIAEHGDVYGLINNAALGSDGLLPTMHNREIEDVIRVNVTSPIVLTKYLVRPMLSARQGRIVNISSIVARTGYRGLAAYGASKAAIEGFTRSFARDIGSRGITVNAVAPGFLETDMTSSLQPSNLERIKNRSALNRFATTSEVAESVAFLLSDAAGSITGTILTVDAGSTA